MYGFVAPPCFPQHPGDEAMWTSLNALTQQAAQMAASAVKEAGLDATLVRQGGARGFVCMGLSLAAPCGT